jgi:hypothetical protein
MSSEGLDRAILIFGIAFWVASCRLSVARFANGNVLPVTLD